MSLMQAEILVSDTITIKLYLNHKVFKTDGSQVTFLNKEYSFNRNLIAKMVPHSSYGIHIKIPYEELNNLENQNLIVIEQDDFIPWSSNNLPEAYYDRGNVRFFVRFIKEQKIPQYINVFFKDSFIKNPFVLEAIRSYGIDTTELTYACFDDGYLGSMLLNSFSFALSIDYKKIKTLEKHGAFKVYRALYPIKNIQDNVVAIFWNPEYHSLGQSKICFVTLA